MATNPHAPPKDRVKKRSVLGSLFNPRFGSSLQPMRESTNIFLQLMAGVFAQYQLIPKNYAALRDPRQLSLFHILRTAWCGLEFTRDGLAKILMFVAIVGMMLCSACIAISAVFSLLMGHAHAATVADSSAFAPASNDVAQAWLDYMFNDVPMPNYYDQMGNAIPQSLGLQEAFTSVLAFYSDAILLVAAVILFYHLTAMLAETAHHGVPMGKRADQIWAPIRLVVAVGLLIPINGGLSCGQYIVVKMAELGSGLASQAWDKFLDAMNSYTPTAIPPNSPIVTQIAADLISSEACVYSYNARLDQIIAAGQGVSGMSTAKIPTTPIKISNQTIGGHLGTKYSFSPPSLIDQDICGWYFLPAVPSDADAATQAAYQAQSIALANAMKSFVTDGQLIKIVMPPDVVSAEDNPGAAQQSSSQQPSSPPVANQISLDPSVLNDVIAYQVSLGSSMAALASSTQSQTSAAIEQIRPYGWTFAGALLPMVERMQGMVSNAVTAGMPQTHPPAIAVSTDAPSAGFFAYLFNTAAQQRVDEAWDVRKQVAIDLGHFTVYMSKSWAQTVAKNTECAAMLGLQDGAQDAGWGASFVNRLFSLIDYAAGWTGVWSSGLGTGCGNSEPSTFKLGVDVTTGTDPLAAIAKLGHSNIDTAFLLLSAALGGKLGAMAAGVGGAAAGSVAEPGAGSIVGFIVGVAAESFLSAAAGPLELAATVFMACGFVLAFVLPMFPFTRFFFAVLSWFGAIIEAVIAVPLIALAHLNPEGAGLAGDAKNAYFFVFNIFLRPILTVFGLVAGLVMFLLAVSLLTYTYSLAVAASGGTANGHEALSKIVYSVLYVAMLYICANHAFAMIDHIPANALSWLGKSGQATPKLGDAQHMAQFESLVGSYTGQQVLSNVNTATGKVADGLGEASTGLIKQSSERKKTKVDNALGALDSTMVSGSSDSAPSPSDNDGNNPPPRPADGSSPPGQPGGAPPPGPVGGTIAFNPMDGTEKPN